MAKNRVTYTVGPSEYDPPGVDWHLGDSVSPLNSGGWECSYTRLPRTMGEWVERLQRHVRLPSEVKRAGLRWADADVRPLGAGLNHLGYALDGVAITWTLENSSNG